jgi:hypothetical protein
VKAQQPTVNLTVTRQTGLTRFNENIARTAKTSSDDSDETIAVDRGESADAQRGTADRNALAARAPSEQKVTHRRIAIKGNRVVARTRDYCPVVCAWDLIGIPIGRDMPITAGVVSPGQYPRHSPGVRRKTAEEQNKREKEFGLSQ